MKLGDKVRIKNKYVRHYAESEGNKFPVTWKPEPLSAIGIYIGTRHINEGYTKWNGESHEFITTSRIKAALVVTHERKAPFYAELNTLELAV